MSMFTLLEQTVPSKIQAHLVLLYLQIPHFSQIEGMGQPYVEQVYWPIFV